MNLIYSLLALLISAQASYGQVNFKVNLSPKHQKKLSNTKDYRKKLDRYHKYYSKDSTKAKSSRDKNYKAKFDSLRKADRKRLGVYEELDVIKGDMDLNDTSAVTFSHLKKIAGENEAFGEELKQLEALEQLHGPILGQRDSLLTRQYTLDSLLSSDNPKAKAMAEEMMVSNAQAMGGNEYGVLANNKGLDTGELLAGQDQMKSQVEQARGLTSKDKGDLSKNSLNSLSGAKMEKFKATQAQMKLDKLKYSSIGDSMDMSTAVKRSSLQGVPAGKRLYLGGNIQIASTDPLVLEMSPQLGYYFNRKWAAGIGINYKNTFGNSEPAEHVTGHSYGSNLFTSYDLTQSLFAHSELGWNKADRLFGEKNPSAVWKSNFLIGLGLKKRISTNMECRIMVLYDAQESSGQRLFGQPVVIKFGFNASEIGRNKLFGNK